MISLAILIGKCVAVGVIWAFLLMLTIFQRINVIKYLIFVPPVAAATYFFPDYRNLIATATFLSLAAFILSWILIWVALREATVSKLKAVSFASTITGISYIVYTLFIAGYIPVIF